MKRILVTGGAGYVGSHICKRLARAGIDVAVFDNLSRGFRDFVKWGPLIEGDIRDTTFLRETLRRFMPDVVIHCAAFAYVGESVANPGLYFDNNVAGTLSLLNAMRDAPVGKLIVSSSCATFGQPAHIPIGEDAPQRPINPYGLTKLIMEQMCHDFEIAHGLRWVALRYFNACGGDPDGEIGERHEPEPHLIPRALMAADGPIAELEILGTDYETPDGTCMRDYIHVVDLAEAHLAAARYLIRGAKSNDFNLGAGRGYSVREVIDAVERIAGKPVPCHSGPRRAGDPPVLIANPAKAMRELGWKANYSDLDTIITTALSWYRKERRSTKLKSEGG